jgi:hypothetical protein
MDKRGKEKDLRLLLQKKEVAVLLLKQSVLHLSLLTELLP